MQETEPPRRPACHWCHAPRPGPIPATATTPARRERSAGVVLVEFAIVTSIFLPLALVAANVVFLLTYQLTQQQGDRRPGRRGRPERPRRRVRRRGRVRGRPAPLRGPGGRDLDACPGARGGRSALCLAGAALPRRHLARVDHEFGRDRPVAESITVRKSVRLGGTVNSEAPVRTCDWCGSPLAPTDPAICEPCLVAFRVEINFDLLADVEPDFDELGRPPMIDIVFAGILAIAASALVAYGITKVVIEILDRMGLIYSPRARGTSSSRRRSRSPRRASRVSPGRAGQRDP